MSDEIKLPALSREGRLTRATAVPRDGKVVSSDQAVPLLEALLAPGDRVVLEGDNQKQADFLAASLAKVDPSRVHDLHMVQSVLALPDHLAVFERGIARSAGLCIRRPTEPKAR